MPERHECGYCKKFFSTKYTLYSHQRNTAYCLAIQKELEETRDKQKKEEQELSTIQKFQREKDRLTWENEELRLKLREQEEINQTNTRELAARTQELEISKKEVEFLKNELESYRNMVSKTLERPTNNTTTITNAATTNKITNGIENFMSMMPPITETHLRDQAQFLQKEHIQQGMDGYARYALDYPLKDRIVCSDFSRRKLQYKNDKGNIVSDPDMKQLSQDLFKAIRERNDELIQDYTGDLLDMMKKDPSPAVAQILTEMCELQREVRRLAEGQKSEMTPTFVKSVCAQTAKQECIKGKIELQ